MAIKSYKGMDKNMRCRGFQYKTGDTYETDNANVCNSGFHACESPLDVFGYYPPCDSRYFEVEQDGELSKGDDDSKVASTKIKIGAEIGIPGLVKAHIDFVKSRTTTEHTDPERATAGNFGAATAGNRGAATAGDFGAATAGDRGAATAGNRGAATAGDFGAATAGNFGAATAGDFGAATAGDSGAATAGNFGAATAGDFGAATAGNRGAATAGDRGAATAGNRGAATAGDFGAATAGDFGAATAGDFGAATAGDSGAATAKGSVSVGKDGCGLVRGNDIKARGGLGAILVICIEEEYSYDIKEWKASIVDGVNLKPDVWYTLKDGAFVEAEE